MKAALWLLPLLATGPAFAQPVLVRMGSHEHFGRVVFEFPQPQSFAVERSGNAVVLHFPGGGDIPDAAGAARNVVAVTGGGDMATLTTSPVARIRALTVGSRVVVDVFDQAVAKPGISRRVAVPVAVGQIGPASFHDRADLPTVSVPVSVPAVAVEGPDNPLKPMTVAPAPEVPPSPAVVPATTFALAAVQHMSASSTANPAVSLPFAASVGAASFQRGEEVWLVFDDRRPIDLHSLGSDELFAGAAVELLPSATLIRLRVANAVRLRLSRNADGWTVQVAENGQAGEAEMPSITPARLLFATTEPSSVVVVPDRGTGRNLLVGTLRAFGPGVPATIRSPEFTVMPSWQGLVIEPVSDRAAMRALPQGFAVETGGSLSPSFEAWPELAGAVASTRRFDFPGDPVAILLRRLQAQTQDEGQAPAQSRLTLRKAAAQTMLALGLGVEAQSLLRLAMTEDPRSATDPELNGLLGIAAIVSGRPSEAGGLDAAGLSGSDDVSLWRAVRTALLNGKSPEAAQAFSTTVGLVLSYPTALENRLLPIVAETMVDGGASKAADALLAKLPDEPLLAFARAARMEQRGDSAAALTLYDALANGRDRLASARAATRAVILRLALGSISPGEAADALKRNFSNWRGDMRERDLRLQTADIQAAAGQWREALGTLRETAQLFPDNAEVINGRAAVLFDAMLHGPGAATIKPLDLVSLAEENTELVARASVAELAPLLADKLLALDLPNRAGPVIQRMITASPEGVSRTVLGARLAAMRLAAGDFEAAATALSTTNNPNLPPFVIEERGLLLAKVAAAKHDVAGATTILAQIGTVPAEELRATILGQDGDWRGAALALGKVAAKTVPDTGPLTPEQQDFLLRLASANARAGDDAALRKLGSENGARMVGARADMFRLLTSAPVSAITDLRRSGQELAMVHDMPAAITTVGKR